MSDFTLEQTEKLLAKMAALDLKGGDSAAAEAVNAASHESETQRVDVPTRLALGVMLVTDCWGPIVLACEAGNDREIRIAAINVVDCVRPQLDGVIRTSNAQAYARVAASLQTLVSGGVMTANTRTALLAMADKPRSWAEVELGRAVTARDVGLARGAQG